MAGELPIQIEKINGLADEKAACGIFTKRITFEGGTVGTIVSTILVRGGEGEDSQTYLRDIFEISTKSLEEGIGGPLEILKEAGEACRSYIEQRNLDASFVNALIYKNAFYVGRYKDVVRVWVFVHQKSLELTFNYGSGLLQPSQVFLIGTEKFFSTFDTTVLAGDNQVDLEGIIDGLATEISADDEQSEIGVAIIYIKSDEKHEADDGGKLAVGTSNKLEQTKEAESQIQDELGAVNAVEPAVYEAKGPPFFAKLKVGNFLSKVFKGLWQEVKKLRRGDIGAVLRLRRNIVMIAFLVLLVLAFSAFMTIRSQKDKEKLAQFNDHMKNASAKFMEGDAILGLNRDRARNALAEADNEVKSALSLVPGNLDAKSLADKITQKLKDTENVSAVDFQTFADIGEPLVGISNTTKGLVVFSAGKMFQLDGNGKVGDKADTGNDVTAGAFSNDGFVLDGGKVYMQSFGLENPKDIADGGSAFDISVFLGNVYLLGPEQIAKYVPIEGGYAKSVDYLNNPEQFSQNSHLVIDGSVWVTNGKSINKYMRGAKEDFSISGLLDPNGEFGEIYTTADSDNLYIVDVSNSALLVIKKDGVYQKAYQSGEFAKSKAVIVDESAGKMYVVAGSKVLVGAL